MVFVFGKIKYIVLAALIALSIPALVIFLFAISQIYAIGVEESVRRGDLIYDVESKRGLLRSREIDLSDVNSSYYSADWVSIVREKGGSIRSYYTPGSNIIRPSGFVVVFDSEGKVFVVIPTDT